MRNLAGRRVADTSLGARIARRLLAAYSVGYVQGGQAETVLPPVVLKPAGDRCPSPEHSERAPLGEERAMGGPAAAPVITLTTPPIALVP